MIVQKYGGTSVGLVALAIRAAGGKARSFLGHQCKIVTDSSFSRARIVSIESQPLRDALAAGEIAVIARKYAELAVRTLHEGFGLST